MKALRNRLLLLKTRKMVKVVMIVGAPLNPKTIV